MMTRSLAILLVTMAALFPTQAMAAICFQLSPYSDVVVLELQGAPAGGFLNLIGEVVGTCGDGTSMPFNGTAHLRDDGKAHIGFVVHSPDVTSTVTCTPYSVQGTLDPPSFNSGAGFVGSASLAATAVTFVSVSCPAIPQ